LGPDHSTLRETPNQAATLLDAQELNTDNGFMTRSDLIKRLKQLDEKEFARVAPFLEADLEAVEDLAALHREIEAGRKSAATEPLLEAKDVYARVRQALSR
jgi:hypothetical protein